MTKRPIAGVFTRRRALVTTGSSVSESRAGGRATGADIVKGGGDATWLGCCTFAKCCPSNSATSLAVWKRSIGFLACSLTIMSQSQSGISGLISRIGVGVSSITRFITAMVPDARNGGRPVHIVYSTLPRLNKSAR